MATERGLRAQPRAAALAYVLAVVLVGASVVGVAGYGAAGALNWIAQPPSTPAPSTQALPSPTSWPLPSPTESLEPGESEGPSDEPRDTAEPGGPDDNGEGSGEGWIDAHGEGSSTSQSTPASGAEAGSDG